MICGEGGFSSRVVASIPVVAHLYDLIYVWSRPHMVTELLCTADPEERLRRGRHMPWCIDREVQGRAGGHYTL